jgi:hypothetical protein
LGTEDQSTNSEAESRRQAASYNHHFSTMSASKTEKPSLLQMNNDEVRFPLFAKLPAEIRDMIWSAAIVPRVLKVTMDPHVSAVPDSTGSRLSFFPKINSHKTPSLLRVSREARAVALNSYELSFCDPLQGKAVYFDFAGDTLLFTTCLALLAFYGIKNPVPVSTSIQDVKNALPQQATVIEKSLRHIAFDEHSTKVQCWILPRFDRLESIFLKGETWRQSTRAEQRELWEFFWRQEFEKRGQDREAPEITYLSPDEFQEKFAGALE